MQGKDHEGHRDRMRKRFLQGGLSSFAPHEMLELLLFFAIPRRNVNPLAHQLLQHFGSLSAVLEAEPEQLMQVPGIGESAAVLLALLSPIVREADQKRFGDKPCVTNYREAKDYCQSLFQGAQDEVLYVVCLDAQGRVLRAVRAITGTIDEIAIYPRTIVSAAIRHNAHSIVLAHNHPSGVREPSDADIRTTDQLRETLSGMDIKLLDHIIYADGECLSMEQWRHDNHAATVYPHSTQKAADAKRPRKGGKGT